VWNLDLSTMKPFSSLDSNADTSPRAAAPLLMTPDSGKAPGAGRHNLPCSDWPVSASSGVGDADDATAQCARMQIAQCRAQLAARRASQGNDTAASKPQPTIEDPKPPSRANSSAAKGGNAELSTELSNSGRHASVGTSMTDTLNTGHGISQHDAPSDGTQAGMASWPKGASPIRGAPVPPSMMPSEHLLADLVKSSARQEACLSERLTALRTLRSFWEAGEVKKMLQYLQRLDSPSALDIIRSGMLTQGGRLDLECALVLIPTLATLLQSTYDEHIVVAVEAVLHILHTFGQLISTTRAIARDMLGVDLSAEARQQRCQACYEHFAALIPRVRELSTGKVGQLAKQPALELLQALHDELGLE